MAEAPTAPRLESLHPRLAGFDAFFSGALMQQLEAAEAERRRHVRPVLLKGGLVIATGIAIAISGFLADDVETFGQLSVAGGILLVMFGLAWVAKPLRKARESGSGALIQGVCGFLKLRYSHAVGDFPFARFGGAGVIPQHDRKTLEDRIGGEHDGVAFELIEAKLEQRRTTTDGKGRTRTYYVTVFNGLLIDAASPRSFQGRTLVTADSGKIGNLLGGLFRKDERVTLESPEFEKHFEVYATDQVEARVLLTTTMMERLVALKDEMKTPPRAAFVDGRVLLAIPRTGDQFEAGGLFSSLTEPKHIQEAVSELCAVFRVLDTLQLRQGAKA
jgi:hypothetical protein